MRIVAGRFRGRSLKAPHGTQTRPTTDRVRESVFSSLVSLAGEDLGGGTVLDAFAGSGALGLEALSRGAGHVVFAENARPALDALKANIVTVGAGRETTIVASDVLSAAARGTLPRAPFALLLLDPPYRLDAADVGSMLVALAANAQLTDGALVVYEHASADHVEWPTGFSAVRSKRYGSTAVDIAVYENEEENG